VRQALFSILNFYTGNSQFSQFKHTLLSILYALHVSEYLRGWPDYFLVKILAKKYKKKNGNYIFLKIFDHEKSHINKFQTQKNCHIGSEN
jgi:hypothetical protein